MPLTHAGFGEVLAESLIAMDLLCKTNNVRVTHYRLTQKQFDALCAFVGGLTVLRPCSHRPPMFNGYPIKVYP